MAVSVTSCWEIAQLVKRKRIDLPMSAEKWVELASIDLEILPITKEIALLSEELENHIKTLLTVSSLQRALFIKCLW